MPYVGRDPENAGTAAEYAHLKEAKAYAEAEDRRKAAAKVRWAKEDAAQATAAIALRASRQKASDDQLRAELRQRFFRANPAGSEADFSRLLPAMRDVELLSRAQHGVSDEVEALRARTQGF